MEVMTILVKGSEEALFKCSKSLLVDKSDYFNAMFSSGMVESHKNMVEIKDVEVSVLRKLIDYMKTDTLQLTNDSVYGVTEGASRFQV